MAESTTTTATPDEKPMCSMCLARSSAVVECSRCGFSVCSSCCELVEKKKQSENVVILENPKGLCEKAQELLTKGPAGENKETEQPMELLQKALTKLDGLNIL